MVTRFATPSPTNRTASTTSSESPTGTEKLVPSNAPRAMALPRASPEAMGPMKVAGASPWSHQLAAFPSVSLGGLAGSMGALPLVPLAPIGLPASAPPSNHKRTLDLGVDGGDGGSLETHPDNLCIDMSSWDTPLPIPSTAGLMATSLPTGLSSEFSSANNPKSSLARTALTPPMAMQQPERTTAASHDHHLGRGSTPAADAAPMVEATNAVEDYHSWLEDF